MFEMHDWDWMKTMPGTALWTSSDLILMQFTGLKDKNGVEIYEGDILRSETRATTHLVMKWETDWARFMLHGHNHVAKKGFRHSPMKARTLEVIGNRYENPELLEPNKQE